MSNSLGGDAFTRNVTDGRRTDFGTKLIYHFFLKKKAGIKTMISLDSNISFASTNIRESMRKGCCWTWGGGGAEEQKINKGLNTSKVLQPRPPFTSMWPITWSAWLGSQTLRPSNRTSQVRKIVHNFHYAKSISCGKCKKNPSYFSAHNCVKVSPGFAAVFQITSTNWSVYPIRKNFPFFLQLVEVIWETTANRRETLTPSCAEKYEFFLHFTYFWHLVHTIWFTRMRK